MEIILTVILFASIMLLLSFSFVLKGNKSHRGCCGGENHIGEKSPSCETCPSKEQEVK
jgi:hypothetical protein